MIKFLFLQGKRYKAIQRELTALLTEEAVRIETVKRWCQHFKDGDFSVVDDERPGCCVSDLSNAIIQ
jgi:hypothetical protein